MKALVKNNIYIILVVGITACTSSNSNVNKVKTKFDAKQIQELNSVENISDADGNTLEFNKFDSVDKNYKTENRTFTLQTRSNETNSAKHTSDNIKDLPKDYDQSDPSIQKIYNNIGLYVTKSGEIKSLEKTITNFYMKNTIPPFQKQAPTYNIKVKEIPPIEIEF